MGWQQYELNKGMYIHDAFYPGNILHIKISVIGYRIYFVILDDGTGATAEGI